MSHNPRVDLHAHQKQKEHKPDIRRQRQRRYALTRENTIGEVGDAAHDGGPEDDAADDLRYHARLAETGEEDGEELGEDDDDADLDDPEAEGVCGGPFGGVVARDDARLPLVSQSAA